MQERTSNLLDGMIAVLDYRDTETQWHSRRVSRFTCRIAQALGVTDPNEMRTIEMGSLLHDIGKIGVRDAVLAAFRAGSDGVILSRKYSEMKLANLAGAGVAVRQLNKT